MGDDIETRLLRLEREVARLWLRDLHSLLTTLFTNDLRGADANHVAGLDACLTYVNDSFTHWNAAMQTADDPRDELAAWRRSVREFCAGHDVPLSEGALGEV